MLQTRMRYLMQSLI